MVNENRKPYLKPEIKQVELRLNEAVLTICKTAASGGGQNTTASCVDNGNPGACVDQEGS